MYLSEAEGVGQWEAIVSSLVKAGTDVYTAKIGAKAQKSAAESSARAAEAQARIEAAAARQALIAQQAAQGGGKAASILTYGLIGLGVIGVGGVIAWKLMKGKKGTVVATAAAK